MKSVKSQCALSDISPEVKLLKNPFSQRGWGLAMAEAANGMIMKHQDASELCKRAKMKAGNTDTSWNRTKRLLQASGAGNTFIFESITAVSNWNLIVIFYLHYSNISRA
jgi:hypothetical protein